MAKEEATSGGISFIGALTLIFITLKLLKKIDWILYKDVSRG